MRGEQQLQFGALTTGLPTAWALAALLLGGVLAAGCVGPLHDPGCDTCRIAGIPSVRYNHPAQAIPPGPCGDEACCGAVCGGLHCRLKQHVERPPKHVPLWKHWLPGLIDPPAPRFHPVPTRPVFSPRPDVGNWE